MDRNAFALQFVHNRTVINPPDRHPPAVPLVVKLRTLFLDLLDIDRSHSQHLLGQQKVRQRFLRLRMNLHEDDILRILFAHDRTSQQLAVRSRIQPAEKVFQIQSAQPEYIDITLRQSYLIGVEGRESLQLHKLRLQLALGIANQPKIYLYKQRMRGLIGDAELGGNRGLRSRFVHWIFNQLPDEFFPVFCHSIQQGLRKKTWGLRQSKLDRSAACLLDPPQEYLVFFGSEIGVEFGAQGRDHVCFGTEAIGINRSSLQRPVRREATAELSPISSPGVGWKRESSPVASH